MKRYCTAILSAFAFISIVGCNTSTKQTDTKNDRGNEEMNEEKQSLKLFGTYKGTFPCVNCGGKDMSLTLRYDGTYHLEYEYIDTDEGVIEENGTYNILDDVVIETVTPSSGIKTYYKYVKGNLILSDSIGTENDGEPADMYILKRHR